MIWTNASSLLYNLMIKSKSKKKKKKKNPDQIQTDAEDLDQYILCFGQLDNEKTKKIVPDQTQTDGVFTPKIWTNTFSLLDNLMIKKPKEIVPDQTQAQSTSY